MIYTKKILDHMVLSFALTSPQSSTWALASKAKKKSGQSKKTGRAHRAPLDIGGWQRRGPDKRDKDAWHLPGTCPALIRRKNKQDNEEEEEGREENKMNRNRHDSQRKTPLEGQLATE